ncbi:MAG: hypothetical protein JOY52_12320 [Hyphomicrobiales bacterium]|nr:hypothetical protein [Hyphomicrobiales bacterium]
MPTPTPLALTEDEFAIVMSAAAPILPGQRPDFLAALADELGRHETRGPGLVHRLAADLQRKFVISAQSVASQGERRPVAKRAATA